MKWIRTFGWALAVVGLGSLAWAQQVSVMPTFETLAGGALERDAFAAGDVVVLRVDVVNTGDADLDVDEIWVAFPPVARATLFGNSSSGFAFPDRMIDEDGNEVAVDYGEGDGLTQLYALDEALAPGDTATLRLRVTVLSSTTDLAELPAKIHLVDARGDTVGVNRLEDPDD